MSAHSNSSNKTYRYSNNSKPSFYNENQIELGIKNNTLFRGTLRVNSQKRHISYVSAPGASIDIIIETEGFRNRTVHGDDVVVELLHENAWSVQLQPRAEIRRNDDSKQPLEVSQHIDADSLNHNLWLPRQELVQNSLTSNTTIHSEAPVTIHPIDVAARRLSKQPSGRVVGVFPRKEKLSLVGRLEASCQLQPGQSLPSTCPDVSFKATDPRYPNLIVLRLELPDAYVKDPYKFQNQIFVAEIDPIWPQESDLPRGKNIRSLGEIGSIQAETEALLVEHSVNHGQFQDEVVEPLKQLLGIEDIDSTSRLVHWTIPEEEIKKRRDLRSYRIFTIDPPTAKDLDDALHITKIDENTYEIGVHIADVSYFIKEGSPLDTEAWNRATSVYLVQKVIPMLPPILCEQLCSLNPNVDRLAFSCIWKMHLDGTLCTEEPWFGRTVIRSCAKLDYPTAQRMVDGIIPSVCLSNDRNSYYANISEEDWETARRPPEEHQPWDISQDVQYMNAIAMNRRAARLLYGALVLNIPKLSFKLDSNGNPMEVGAYIIRQSNNLVEEYMLLANYLVAQELVAKADKTAFLRRHPPPDLKHLQDLEDLAQHIGIKLDTSTAQTLQAGLSQLTQAADPMVVHAITACAMYPMQLAKYFTVSMSKNSDFWRHYALSIPYYTHFTSPIRRYADLVVHRLLAKVVEGEAMSLAELTPKQLEKYEITSEQCNTMKECSKKAQERSDEIFFTVYLMTNPMDVPAVVIGIGAKSFTVLVPQYGTQARLFVDEMVDISCSYDERHKVMTLIRIAGYSRNNARKSDKIRTCVPNTIRFQRLDIKLMTQLMVHLSAKVTAPIGVIVSLIGGIDCQHRPFNSRVNTTHKSNNNITNNSNNNTAMRTVTPPVTTTIPPRLHSSNSNSNNNSNNNNNNNTKTTTHTNTTTVPSRITNECKPKPHSQGTTATVSHTVKPTATAATHKVVHTATHMSEVTHKMSSVTISHNFEEKKADKIHHPISSSPSSQLQSPNSNNNNSNSNIGTTTRSPQKDMKVAGGAGALSGPDAAAARLKEAARARTAAATPHMSPGTHTNTNTSNSTHHTASSSINSSTGKSTIKRAIPTTTTMTSSLPTTSPAVVQTELNTGNNAIIASDAADGVEEEKHNAVDEIRKVPWIGDGVKVAMAAALELKGKSSPIVANDLPVPPLKTVARARSKARRGNRGKGSSTKGKGDGSVDISFESQSTDTSAHDNEEEEVELEEGEAQREYGRDVGNEKMSETTITTTNTVLLSTSSSSFVAVMEVQTENDSNRSQSTVSIPIISDIASNVLEESHFRMDKGEEAVASSASTTTTTTAIITNETVTVDTTNIIYEEIDNINIVKIDVKDKQGNDIGDENENGNVIPSSIRDVMIKVDVEVKGIENEVEVLDQGSMVKNVVTGIVVQGPSSVMTEEEIKLAYGDDVVIETE
eukprot:gene500-948_t